MNLFIAWNAYSVLEFLAVEKNSKDFYCFIDPIYNEANFENINSFINLCLNKNIFKGLLNENDLYINNFDKLYCMSDLNDKLINLLNKVSYKKLNLLQEGLCDYLKHDYSKNQLNLCKKADLYLNNFKDFKYSYWYKTVNNIFYDDSLIDFFCSLFDFNYEEIDLIFFTSPIDADFSYNNYPKIILDYLEKNFKGKNILIKRHPRDFINYKSNNFNIIQIDSNIPGQLINMKYNCKKIYAYPSTVILSEKDLSNSNIIKCKDLINEKKYIEAFNYEKMKECNIIEI